jgi:hypothetical protein
MTHDAVSAAPLFFNLRAHSAGGLSSAGCRMAK